MPLRDGFFSTATQTSCCNRIQRSNRVRLLVVSTHDFPDMLSPSTHLPKDRVHSHVPLFRGKFWASKAMYRGSAAEFLALQESCAIPGIPQQIPQKGDNAHFVDFLRLSSM